MNQAVAQTPVIAGGCDCTRPLLDSLLVLRRSIDGQGGLVEVLEAIRHLDYIGGCRARGVLREFRSSLFKETRQFSRENDLECLAKIFQLFLNISYG